MNSNPLQLPFVYNNVSSDPKSLRNVDEYMSKVDTFGLLLCTQGSAKIYIDSSEYVVKDHYLFFYAPAFYAHRGDVSEDFEGIVLGADYGFVIPNLISMLDINSQLYIRNHPLLKLDEDTFQLILRLLHSIRNLLIEPAKRLDKDHLRIRRDFILSLAKSISFGVIEYYFRKIPVKNNEMDRRDMVVQTFFNTLSKNFSVHRDVAFYARQQSLTAGYFSNLVRQQTGRSAIHWIVDMVINYAKQRLCYTDDSIKEIATQLNFPTQTFFGKYFKQYVGMSPRAYRQQCRLKDSRS